MEQKPKPFSSDKENGKGNAFFENVESYITELQGHLYNVLAVFEKYKDYLRKAEVTFKSSISPAANISPDEFLDLLKVIINNPPTELKLFLVHGDLDGNGNTRKISVKYMINGMDMTEIDNHATDIFLTDLDRVNGKDEYDEIIKKIKIIETTVPEAIDVKSTEVRVLRLK